MKNNYPVQVTITYPETQSRLLAVFSIPLFIVRAILAIPLLILVAILQIVAFVAAWIAMWVIAFTGKQPRGLHNLVTGYMRLNTRVNSYIMGLTDKYPPFRLDP